MWPEQYEQYQGVIELSDDDGEAFPDGATGVDSERDAHSSLAMATTGSIAIPHANESAEMHSKGSTPRRVTKRPRSEPTPLRGNYGDPSDNESCEFTFEEDDDCQDFIPRGASRRMASFDTEVASSSQRRSKKQVPRSLQSILLDGRLSAPRELAAADSLIEAQTRAVSVVAREAQPRSEAAVPALAKRLKQWGYPDSALQQVLDYIRNEAPIIVHIDLVSRMKFLQQDTHYRNQFETKSTRGSSNLDKRRSWEDRLFQDAYQHAVPFDRVKYGVLNAVNDPCGIAIVASQYGLDYLILKCVRLRTTFSDKDSCSQGEVASCEWYAHVLRKYSDQELRAVVEVALGERLFVDSAILDTAAGGYKEVQIHGELLFGKHVEAVVVHPSRRGTALEEQIQGWCAKLGVRFQWMPNDRSTNAQLEGSNAKTITCKWDQHELLRTVPPESPLWRWRPHTTEDMAWLRFDAFASAALEKQFPHLRQHGTLHEDAVLPALPVGIIVAIESAGDHMHAIATIDEEEVILNLERCTAGSAAYARASASKSKKKTKHWEYCAAARGVGNWQPYDAASCAALELALMNGQKQATLHIGETVYTIDLELMVQINTQSNYRRLVRRLHAPSKV